ncbi:MAG: hypothetical protein KDC92_13020, partial [Bacteroidetes bacterium]|nr:hypothetical protein [Bacteroidota bacterium]
MKKHYSTISYFTILSAILLIPFASKAQLSGSYTLDPTKPGSNTNYANWASVISDLSSGSRSDGGTAQGSGVSGAVTITVYDTVYSSTAISIGAITGASASNTITFKS